MNVYIIADIEGMGGVVFYCRDSDTHMSHEISLRNRNLITEEVNAAVRGAFAAGAETVIVHDHHAVGYNILPEKLDERAELIHGRNEQRMLLNTLHPDLDETIDAVVLLGMHPKAATLKAGTPHSLITVETETGQTYELGEAGNSAAFAGAFNVPTVFTAGDEAVCREIKQQIPGIHTYATKKHYASQLARTKSPILIRKEIETGVKKALEAKDSISPLKIVGKCRVWISDRNPDKKWPIEPRWQDSFQKAMLDTLTQVPWYEPITEIDDGWRFPDKMTRETPNSKWN